MQWKTILVPHDFSASANHAAAIARDEAKHHGGKLVLLHVIDLPHQLAPDTVIVPEATGAPIGVRDYAVGMAEAHLEDLAGRLRKDGIAVSTFIRLGSPSEEIVDLADEQHADVVVMGTHGRTGIKHLIAGSVAERVVRTCKVPVLTVRHPD